MSATDGTRMPKARITGLCYLAVIAGGIFAEGVVRSPLTVIGNASATLQSIAGHQEMWRAGLAVHLSYLLLTVPMSLLLYELLRAAGPTLARFALVFSLMCSTIEAASLPLTAVPLAIARDHSAIAGFTPEQLQSLGYLAVRLFSTAFSFATFLFSGFCLFTGLLIARSGLVARPIGWLLMLGGIGYFVGGDLRIIAPGAAASLFPWLLLPGFFGEVGLAFWLVLRGVSSETPEPARGRAGVARC
jgi:Domain of unknown function (DUF4386)